MSDVRGVRWDVRCGMCQGDVLCVICGMCVCVMCVCVCDVCVCDVCDVCDVCVCVCV